MPLEMRLRVLVALQSMRPKAAVPLASGLGALGLGAVLANLIGTTGASVLLIRPLLRANAVEVKGGVGGVAVWKASKPPSTSAANTTPSACSTRSRYSCTSGDHECADLSCSKRTPRSWE